jgi:serine/threonine protein kinase/predicted negative regulator of RcsB-dependent stress response
MKNCATCHSAYPDSYLLCPQDGTPLKKADVWADGGVIRGKYRILSKIGQGGMGAVYKGLHLHFQELRALKVMSPELMSDQAFVKRFKHEAVFARKLQHPNAVRVEDFDETEDGQPFIVMEYIEGRSLKSCIEKESPFSISRVCPIIKQVASALDAAHGLGIIHRDVKPENIILVERPNGELAKVLDFGVAKISDRAGDTAGMSLTLTGTTLGTPSYMSPEQALAKHGDVLDGRSDIYSLGVIMYQMLTGELPLKADTPFEMLAAHVRTPPRPIREVRPELYIPEPIANLVMRMLEKNRELRPPTAKVLIQELEGAEKSVRGPATSQLLPASPPIRKAYLEGMEQEQLERERAEQEGREHATTQAERAEAERLARERVEQERLAREQIEQERREQERAEVERREQARIQAERAEAERLGRNRAEQERLTRERAEQERQEQERAEAKRRETEQAEAERLARQQAAEQERRAPGRTESVWRRRGVTILVVILVALLGLALWQRFRSKPRRVDVADILRTGEVYLAQGEYAKAIAEFRHGLELDPTNQELKGKLDQAQKLASQADVQKRVSDALNTGEQFLQQGKFDEAIREFQKGLELDPTNGELRSKLEEARNAENRADVQKRISEALEKGEKYLDRHQYHDAMTEFQMGLQLDPTNQELKGKLDQARQAAREAAADALKKSTAYVDVGKYDEAIRELQNGLSADPTNQELKRRLDQARRAKEEEHKLGIKP